ncbi:hypothetical protein DV515_00012897 [Chloebia gouldiae]|uniref:Uncharacterized protein n=1 Tax=Chloebia gouldiae TaxID=44316 RepID=A0A3L8S2G5_CHLGU|nr:hypothetical protein DV515_00012897 [Chloebia gouldiae]
MVQSGRRNWLQSGQALTVKKHVLHSIPSCSLYHVGHHLFSTDITRMEFPALFFGLLMAARMECAQKPAMKDFATVVASVSSQQPSWKLWHSKGCLGEGRSCPGGDKLSVVLQHSLAAPSLQRMQESWQLERIPQTLSQAISALGSAADPKQFLGNFNLRSPSWFSLKACIDENLDMVKFLVENGANVNQQDNEGWTPLHAVASCGYLNIAEYLISHGANVAAVNSEGEVPSDIAEEAAMKDLLLEQVKKQGVDLELSRKEEEQQMLQDARQWLNSGRIEDIKQPRTGATALHVAAAKGYSEVMRLLIQAGFNLNVQDNDGWTPLHAAAHWGVKEACSILAEALCDMDIRNKLGQTPFDVADEGLVEHLEMLQKKQTVLRSEKETRNKLIEADMNGKPQNRLFTNKEKILYEEDTLKSMETEEENKDSSSSSSEEEEAEDEVSESDAEKESERKEEPFANHSSRESRPSITEQMPPPEPNSFTASARRVSEFGLNGDSSSAQKQKFSWLSKSEEQKDESPSSWRLGLRKTGSHNMLSEVAATREAQRDKTSSIYRSSSSPRISALLDNKEKDRENKSYLATIVPRRLSSTSDTEEKENRESAVNLVRSGSYSRQPWRDEPKGNEAPHSGAPATYVSTYLKSSDQM